MPKYETRQRKVLLSLLCNNADRPLALCDIKKMLDGDSISQSAIYRNLSELEKEGKIQRLTIGGNKKVYYRYTEAKGCERHIHLSCSKCGKTFHMDIPSTNNLVNDVLSKSDFTVDRANTVLYGVCSNCRH